MSESYIWCVWVTRLTRCARPSTSSRFGKPRRTHQILRVLDEHDPSKKAEAHSSYDIELRDESVYYEVGVDVEGSLRSVICEVK